MRRRPSIAIAALQYLGIPFAAGVIYAAGGYATKVSDLNTEYKAVLAEVKAMRVDLARVDKDVTALAARLKGRE